MRRVARIHPLFRVEMFAEAWEVPADVTVGDHVHAKTEAPGDNHRGAHLAVRHDVVRPDMAGDAAAGRACRSPVLPVDVAREPGRVAAVENHLGCDLAVTPLATTPDAA